MIFDMASLTTFFADNTIAITILGLTIANTVNIARIQQWKKDKFKDK